MSLKAVVFDMDGVLTATVHYHYLSWKEALATYGIGFNLQENEKLLGLTRRRSLETILGERRLPEEDMQQILELKQKIYLDYVAQMTSADLLPGVSSLLEELRAGGTKIGVASASRNTRQVLEGLGVHSLIDTTSDSNTIRRSKPAPDVFLHAAQSLEVEPGDCLVLEDSAPGITAAKAAGMCVVGLGPQERVGQADAVFPDLSDVHCQNLADVYHHWIEKKEALSL